ncbi:hypothetical protein CLOLEP_02689 [[Clostridium] leptum DSM 753]|uniref:Uncharacterized protein n=1 Tax=[Clostridium] leptum DSM 753 TaxID=428125 RepID=A7VVS6_9FIRM|nr:hypothetical protein CLOLEP_02689 [[Clostridium] leptum DSM 753]
MAKGAVFVSCALSIIALPYNFYDSPAEKDANIHLEFTASLGRF